MAYFCDLQKSNEIQELTEKLENVENSSINLNEALNNSRREITRLQTELQSETEKSKKCLIQSVRCSPALNLNNLLIIIWHSFYSVIFSYKPICKLLFK